MSTSQNNDYELSERAAIRECDAGIPPAEAELLAGQEVKDRQPLPEKTEPPQSRLEQLIAERERVGKAMAAAGCGSDELKELSVKWQNLCSQILEERKRKK